jgi:hypothetical protein
MDDRALVLVDRMLGEAEGVDQERDRGTGVVVAG